jgi:hypothetical protein
MHARLQRAQDRTAEWRDLCRVHAYLLQQAQHGGCHCVMNEAEARTLQSASGKLLHCSVANHLCLYNKLSKMQDSTSHEVAAELHKHNMWSLGSTTSNELRIWEALKVSVEKVWASSFVWHPIRKASRTRKVTSLKPRHKLLRGFIMMCVHIVS